MYGKMARLFGGKVWISFLHALECFFNARVPSRGASGDAAGKVYPASDAIYGWHAFLLFHSLWRPAKTFDRYKFSDRLWAQRRVLQADRPAERMAYDGDWLVLFLVQQLRDVVDVVGKAVASADHPL